MKILLSILIVICGVLEAYDTSFSEIFESLYEKNHTYKNDWCDQLKDQIAKITTNAGRSVSYLELKNAGVDEDCLDAMATAFCQKYQDAYIATVWPTMSYESEKMVYQVLSEYATVVYHKKFTLKNNGPRSLLNMIPEKVQWISKDFHRYFPAGKNEYALMCFVVRSPSQQCMILAKRKLRGIVKLDPYCMHINDTHPQCLDLAYALLNNNSIHFLNHQRTRNFRVFNSLMPRYIKFIKRKKIPLQDVCIDGSAVLSAYGLRDCALDFDFLCTKRGEFGRIHPLDHHNEAWEKLGYLINEVIYNPKKHFYFKGLKFVSLTEIRNFKFKQGRANDMQDVKNIDEFLKNHL
ncbi:MAG: hypothetical protein K9M07_05095 [Simkaniaceae bacterium]|nr:hypothetical protein [Simkaniaceae bacterium]